MALWHLWLCGIYGFVASMALWHLLIFDFSNCNKIDNHITLLVLIFNIYTTPTTATPTTTTAATTTPTTTTAATTTAATTTAYNPLFYFYFYFLKSKI